MIAKSGLNLYRLNLIRDLREREIKSDRRNRLSVILGLGCFGFFILSSRAGQGARLPEIRWQKLDPLAAHDEFTDCPASRDRQIDSAVWVAPARNSLLQRA